MIAIACDHTALALKRMLSEHLAGRGFETKDYGAHGHERSDYPIYAETAARAVVSGECERGVLICGTGVGMCIAANKVAGARCAVCSEPYSAKLSREHNDANLLALGARVVAPELAAMILDAWLDAEFEGGRHATRVDMYERIAARNC
ncbi:MAG: ribose 5-phosphate isomerase B [Oscillospiraceae bacterium]|jgi:ribose 5-phosphate isomerase B|nr:ribose 5-phosphate isomerase B [Oscillospiraceae bacterium]